MDLDNFVIPAGKAYFNPLVDGSYEGYRYLGDNPEFTITQSTTFATKYSSNSAVREQLRNVPIQTERTATLTLGGMTPENLALFLNGDVEEHTQTAGSAETETLSGVKPGRFYNLGETTSNPMGVRDLSSVSVTDQSGTPTYDEGDDYEIDLETGMLEVLEGGDISDGDDLEVTYDSADTTWVVVTSSDQRVVKGKLMFVSNNSEGEEADYYMPEVTLSPAGDLRLNGGDGTEWQQIPMQLSILKPDGQEALTMATRPGVT